jgi:hypothetical protein
VGGFGLANALAHFSMGVFHQRQTTDIIQALANLAGAVMPALHIERSSRPFREVIIGFANPEQLFQ